MQNINMSKCLNTEFDVALSFAGQQRPYVERVANFLRAQGLRVFYDMYEDVELWGKDLYQHLDDIYQNKAKYTVIFISKDYKEKLWTNHELKSAQARAFAESEEYILPARFDDTTIPGVRATVGYIDLNGLTPFKFARKIQKKLGVIEKKDFLPSKYHAINQVLTEVFDVTEEELRETVLYIFDKLKRTNENERHLIAILMLHTCSHLVELDLHEDITLIERYSGFSKSEIIETLKGLKNLGFEFSIKTSIQGCKEEQNETEYEQLSVSFFSRRELVFDNLTNVLYLMGRNAVRGMCENCAYKTLTRMDFEGIQDELKEEEMIAQINMFVEDDDESDEIVDAEIKTA
jgi:hypothetical protein